MLDGLRQFIADIVSPTAHQDRAFDDTGYRLAATALLVHVISLDGEPSEIEKRKLHSLLETPFRARSRHGRSVDCVCDGGRGEAVDLYHFTSVIMRSVNEEGRLRIVEMMWELVYADGQVSEFEDNVSGAPAISWACLRAIGSISSIVSPPRKPCRLPTIQYC